MYGLLISIGILVGILIAEKVVEQRGLSKDILWDGTVLLIITGLIGARLYHVIEFWHFYSQELILIPQIWRGGVNILGGLVVATIALIIFLKKKKQSVIEWFDIAVISLPMAQAIGRWGNYFNKELLPYALYESLLDLILFWIIFFWSTDKDVRGLNTKIYILGYAIIRLTLEDLRPFEYQVFGYNATKALAITTIIGILFLYVIHSIRSRWFQIKK